MFQHEHDVYQLMKIFTEFSILRRIHNSKQISQTFNHDDDEDDDDLFRNDDVRTTIMSRLPLKSLLEFRSVSKSWRQTIDSSPFRKLHVQNQISNHHNNDMDTVFLWFRHTYARSFCRDYFSWKLSIMFPDTGNSYDDFPAYRDFLENNIGSSGNLGFSGSVHGLICLYETYTSNPIALCNPSLQEIKILPPPPSASLASGVRLVEIGYDEAEKDYKIVQLLTKARIPIAVEVFSRKEKTWRVLENHPLHKGYMIDKPIQRLPGGAAVVHWIGLKWSGSQFDSVIVSFDVRSEALDAIQIPFLKDSNHEVEIFAKNDLFIVFVGDKFWRSDEIGIWEHKRDWIKVGRLRPFDKFIHVEPVAFWKSDGLVLKTKSWGRRSRWNISPSPYDCIIEEIKVVSYYDCISREIVRVFELPGLQTLKNKCSKIVEYRGSFISP